MNIPILSLSLLALLTHGNPRQSCFAAGADIVVATCQRIAAGDPEIDYNFCVSLLNSAPGSHSADVKGLALISINLAKKKARQVLANIGNLIEREKSSTYKKKCLKTCRENYVNAVSDFKGSAKSIDLGRISDARTALSASFDVADTCENCFSDGNILSPLAKDDNYYTNVARIPLAVAALLDN